MRWVRLDPGCELLCDIRLMQPERCLAAQLQHSRDVTAQAEAVQVRWLSGGLQQRGVRKVSVCWNVRRMRSFLQLLLPLPPLLLQRLGELLVSSTALFPGGRRQPGVEALRRALEDPAVFYRVRCDAALALAGLRDEQGQAVGE